MVYAFPEGVFFISSLLTSVWLWLYIVAYGVAYLAVRVDRLKPLVLGYFNIQEKPLTVLSVLASIIIIFSYLLISLSAPLW